MGLVEGGGSSKKSFVGPRVNSIVFLLQGMIQSFLPVFIEIIFIIILISQEVKDMLLRLTDKPGEGSNLP